MGHFSYKSQYIVLCFIILCSNISPGLKMSKKYFFFFFF